MPLLLAAALALGSVTAFADGEPAAPETTETTEITSEETEESWKANTYTDAQGITYQLNGNFITVTGTSTNFSGGEITIPATIEKGGISYPVTGVGDWAFYRCGALKTLTFSAGRAIGLLLCNSNIVYINVESFKFFGGYCWIFPTPILITVLCIAVTALVLKFTALGTYVQAVGINKEAARISGYKSAAIIFICYVVCGLFAGIAGITATSRIYSADTNNIGLNLEMDAILAVALGGNSLGGGKFRLSGSIIGAYTIQAITTTLYALGVSSAQAPVFKAIIVILIVTIQSPAVKAYFAKRAAVKNAMMNAGREAQA